MKTSATHPPPFDSLADSFDDELPDSRLLRKRIWHHLPDYLNNCRHLLELGCGTGVDALQFAERGIKVTATDSSPKMLSKLREKAGRHPQGVYITPRLLDMNHLPSARDFIAEIESSPEGSALRYDVVFTNFGAINCVGDLNKLAGFLWDALNENGYFIAVVMNRCCPIEIAYHLLRLQPKKAFRRFTDGRPVSLGNGESVEVWYPTPRAFSRQCTPYFTRVATYGVGVFLPPPYLTGKIEQKERLQSALFRHESRIADLYPATVMSDLYLIVLQKASGKKD